MIKKSVILLFLGFISNSLFGQTIDSVKAEQIGELVKIHYRISNSTTDQTYQVTIVCSINGNLNTEIKSIFGDVGQVRGGKNEYLIIWDVFKDVEELQSADFTVRAVLLSDKSAPSVATRDPMTVTNQPTERIAIPAPAKVRNKIFLEFDYEISPGWRFEGFGYGLCIGSLGRVGFILCPSYYKWKMRDYPNVGQDADFTGYTTAAGLSFSLFKGHCYPYAAFGFGMNEWSLSNSFNPDKEKVTGAAIRWGANVIFGDTKKATNLVFGFGGAKAVEFIGMTFLIGIAF